MLPRLAAPLASALLALTAACTAGPGQGGASDEPAPEAAATLQAPRLGACRQLTPEDVSRASNDSEVVSCRETHTAETFTVGTFPDRVTDGGSYDNPDLGAYAYRTCAKRFQSFLGGDESTVMRSRLTWAWFRPSEEAWERGARWYRCDVVGGGAQSESYVELPRTARGLLQAPAPDRWMTCAEGPTVAGSVKVPCSEPHSWRAVTTIKLGDPEDPYPGDRVAEVRTREYCSDSVGAWLNYPVDYEYGYTWFHEQEWEAGNRRSICWAKTEQ